jgi:hypothetical protein
MTMSACCTHIAADGPQSEVWSPVLAVTSLDSVARLRFVDRALTAAGISARWRPMMATTQIASANA